MFYHSTMLKNDHSPVKELLMSMGKNMQKSIRGQHPSKFAYNPWILCLNMDYGYEMPYKFSFILNFNAKMMPFAWFPWGILSNYKRYGSAFHIYQGETGSCSSFFSIFRYTFGLKFQFKSLVKINSIIWRILLQWVFAEKECIYLLFQISIRLNIEHNASRWC